MIGVPGRDVAKALKHFPDRFVPCGRTWLTRTTWSARCVRWFATTNEFGVKAFGAFPSGTFPQVAINDKKMYPIYAKCVELDIPIFVCAGVPGPRLKFAPQHVELIDEVMYDFPELVFVTRHGCEPWTELAVKLMLKWPNLYYSTSAFSPKYYPKAIIDYANTRGADKVIYAGYFPDGPVARADHERPARRPVPGRSVAQVPAPQRPSGPQARRVGRVGRVAGEREITCRSALVRTTSHWRSPCAASSRATRRRRRPAPTSTPTPPAGCQPYWDVLVEQGLLALHLPEQFDGDGAGFVELAVVVEETGRGLLPGPLLPTVLTSAVVDRYGDDGIRKSLLPPSSPARAEPRRWSRPASPRRRTGPAAGRSTAPRRLCSARSART